MNTKLFLVKSGMYILLTVLILLAYRYIGIYVVMSGSMEPEIHAGGIVIVNKGSRSPEINDIITYRQNGSIVTHRVVDTADDCFITRGDANHYNDINPVNVSQIVGKVVIDIPLIGFLFMALRSRGGILFLSVLFTCLILRRIFVEAHLKERRN